MTSDLVIKTSEPYEDWFVFRVQGRSGVSFDDGIGVLHGIDIQRNVRLHLIAIIRQSTEFYTFDDFIVYY